ncbi:MAG: Stp1/IreP family PP2C-type Ser/Thr phosphatase [Thermodesulfobacteriota bacterium]
MKILGFLCDLCVSVVNVLLSGSTVVFQGTHDLRIAYKTDTGMARSHNEDTLMVDEDLGLFLVADGLGGHNAGEVASAIAADEVRCSVRQGRSAGADPFELLNDAIFAAHEAIFRRAQRCEDLCDMGTTIVVALLDGESFLIGHVGNSRAYLVAEGTITPVTKDHSFVAEWIEEGLMTPAEARTHKARHGLTMALGVDDEPEPVVACVPLSPPVVLVLCSDGLTEMLDDREILRTIEDARDLNEACNELVDRANRKGGADNITVILIDVDGRDSSPKNPT